MEHTQVKTMTSDLKEIRKAFFQVLENKALREPQPKRQAGEVDPSVLNAQQLKIYEAALDFLSREGGGFFLIKGYAGTGKTFAISRIIEKYLQTMRSGGIALTAPTNKAVRVLLESSDFTSPQLNYLTCHKLLGLKEQITGYGEQIFVQDKKNPPSIEEYGVLVVDEVSMLNDDLFAGNRNIDGIASYVERGLKVIMMGDPAQIPPVGRPDCIPFTDEGVLAYDIEVHELTDIVRQAADSPVIETTMKIRETLGRPSTFPSPESKVVIEYSDESEEHAIGISGVVFLDRKDTEDGEFIDDIMFRAFNSDYFKEDSDLMKITAWRNKTVDFMNNWVRELIYAEEAKSAKIMVGEKLIANSPIFDGPTIVFNTNDEFEVISYRIENESVNNGQFIIKYYNARVRQKTLYGGMKESYVKIVHEESQETYDFILQALIDKAKSVKQGSWEASRAWQDKFAFQEVFADVKYNYAITGHKSQGSTYHHCLVMNNDIDMNKNVKERNRIKYTVCSRPKELLFVIL